MTTLADTIENRRQAEAEAYAAYCERTDSDPEDPQTALWFEASREASV